MLRILALTLCMVAMASAQAPPRTAPGALPPPALDGTSRPPPEGRGHLPPPPADASPHAPGARAPLRRLAMTSPIVLVADVERVAQAIASAAPRVEGVLRPARTLLGGKRSVLVGFVAAPETGLEDGATGVFFLSPAPGDVRDELPLVLDAWIPAHGRSLAVYEHRLDELLEILGERSASRRDARTIEWLVQLVEEPDTRWDGLLDLASPTNARRPTERSYRGLLDASQRERLLTVLLGEARLTPEGTTLASIFPDAGDGRVERWLWEKLNDARDAPAPLAREAMQVLARRLDDRTAELLAEALPSEAPAPEVRRSVVTFLERLEARVFSSDRGRTARRDG